MAQVKLLKIDTDGVAVEFNSTSDEITLASFTVQGGGPVVGATGIDMNGQDVTDLSDLVFADPSVGTINQTAGALVVNNIMAKERENLMTTAGGVAFPVITDNAGQVDAFRLPALAGVPTASPTNGGEGHLVWDSTGNRLFAWNGSAWDDLSSVQAAEQLRNIYTAGEDIDLGECVYISAADTVMLADVSGGGAGSRVVGLAYANSLNTNPVEIVSDGIISGLSGLTAGARYYADPATPGGRTTTVPSGTGNTVVQLGYAKSATALHLQIAQLGRRA